MTPETMAAIKAVGYDDTLVCEMLPSDPAVLGRTSAAMDVIMALRRETRSGNQI